MYGLIQALAMLVYIAILTYYGQHFGFSPKKSFFLGTSAVAIDFTLIILLTWIENGFTNFGAQNAVRVFVFNPILIYAISKVTKISYRSLCDYHAVPAMIWYGLGHFACISVGCCNGFSYYENTTMYAIANFLTGKNQLPNQFLESVGALLIAVFLSHIAKKNHYKTNGYLYYLMLILYGTQRFLWEFLRDNTKLIVFSELKNTTGYFGISSLALWALAMTIEGAILLFFTIRYDKKNH